MRIANHNNRAVLLTSDTEGADIFEASAGRFGPETASLYENWKAFSEWANAAQPDTPVVPIGRGQLGSPSPSPRQVVAVGLNYSAHAAESGFEEPNELPPTFTKFISCLSGPDTVVRLPEGGNTDWEVELVVVIGKEGFGIDVKDAWSHVAGLAIGQDISERVSQLSGPAPQFGLGKSFPGFGPVGPWLVTPDELKNPNDLEIGCSIDGETVQQGRTSELIFPVDKLLAKLSTTITLLPGDIIFTGTPAGVGLGRSPQRYLQDGETLTSWIEGIGTLNQRFVSAAPGTGNARDTRTGETLNVS